MFISSRNTLTDIPRDILTKYLDTPLPSQADIYDEPSQALSPVIPSVSSKAGNYVFISNL